MIAPSAAARSKSFRRVRLGIGRELSIAHATQASRAPERRLAAAPHELSVGDASWTLRRRSEQRITRSSAGEHSEEIRDLRTDPQPRVFISIDGLYTRDGPINLPGELLNSALVTRFVILIFVQRLHCLSPIALSFPILCGGGVRQG